MGALLSDKDADELFEDFEVVSVDRMMVRCLICSTPPSPSNIERA